MIWNNKQPLALILVPHSNHHYSSTSIAGGSTASGPQAQAGRLGTLIQSLRVAAAGGKLEP